MNKISAIPTRYNGVQFRSRLEARWAAFFDLVGWKWDYEPIDLDGYIPDFIVTDPSRQFLVEVKPITRWPCPVPNCFGCDPRDIERTDHDTAITTIHESGWLGESLLVGATLPSPTANHRAIGRGGLRYTIEEVKSLDAEEVFKWRAGRAIARCRRCPRIYLSWCLDDTDAVGLGYSFNNQRWCDCCDSDKAYAVEIDPTQFWREAGNLVQWRGVAAQPESRR